MAGAHDKVRARIRRVGSVLARRRPPSPFQLNGGLASKPFRVQPDPAPVAHASTPVGKPKMSAFHEGLVKNMWASALVMASSSKVTGAPLLQPTLRIGPSPFTASAGAALRFATASHMAFVRPSRSPCRQPISSGRRPGRLALVPPARVGPCAIGAVHARRV